MVVISVLLASLLVVLLLAVDVVIGAELVESVNPLWSSDVEFIIADVVSFITRAEYGAKNHSDTKKKFSTYRHYIRKPTYPKTLKTC